MNTIPAPPRALNQPPIPGVSKTGFYFYTPGSTVFRAPQGQGQRLPYVVTPRILRAFRSKYAPHVGKKQEAKAAAKLQAEQERLQHLTNLYA